MKAPEEDKSPEENAEAIEFLEVERKDLPGVYKRLASDDPDLRGLSLRGIKFKHSDMEELVQALQSNTHLRYLNLSTNLVGDEGLKKLLSLLRKNTNSIVWLDIRQNRITLAGFRSLQKALKHNTTLQFLKAGEQARERGIRLPWNCPRIGRQIKLSESILLRNRQIKQVL